MVNSTKLFEGDEKEDASKGAVPSVDDLRDITGINEEQEDAHDREATNGAAHDIADREAQAGADQGQDETSGADGDTESSDGTGASEDAGNDEQKSLFRNTETGSKKGSAKNALLFGRSKKKVLIGGAFAGTFGLVLALVLLLIIASSLKIPNLAQNLQTLEFTRVTRQFAKNADRVTGASLALEATDDGTYAGLKARYANATGKVSDTWGKLDKYRPSKVVDILGENNGLKFDYKKNGRQLLGISLDNKEFPVSKLGATKYVPGLKNIVTFGNNVKYARAFTPALESSLRANEIGPIVRGAVDNSMRKKLGIGLVAWNVGKYLGKNDNAALQELTKDKITIIEEGAPASDAATQAIKDAEAAAKAEEAKVAGDPTLLDKAIADGGFIQSESAAVDKTLADSGFKELLGALDPLYAVAMPICIVYDGSLEGSGSTIDNNLRQSEATSYFLLSAASQQESGSPISDGSTGLTTAIGALNRNLGDISQSNAYKQASGSSVDTSSTPSAEASAGGQFTLLNATPGINQTVANTINDVANNLCPAFTNTYLAVGVGVGSIIATIFTGGLAGGAEKAAGAGATKAVEIESTNLATQIVGKIIGVEAKDVGASTVSKYLYGTGKDALKNAVGVASATVLAKLIVMNRAGQLNGGFTAGNDLSNVAQAGTNAQAGEMLRVQTFGAPLAQGDVTNSDSTDNKAIATATASKSFSDRYFATSNPTSLFSRMALSISGQANIGIFKSMVRLGASIFRPESFAALLQPIVGHAVAASTNNHYGNVQFGWTDAEQKLIDSSDSYLPLENQTVLDNAGKDAGINIAKTYAKCFGYTADDSGNLTLAMGSGEEGSIGTLLSAGTITRDSSGNVIDTNSTTDCSPKNLGPKNSTFGDLVFRWRLSQSYNTTLDQLTNEQTITAAASDGSTGNLGGPGGSGQFTTDTSTTFPDALKMLTRAQTAISLSGQTCGGSCYHLCAHVAGLLWGYSSTGWGNAYKQWVAEVSGNSAHSGTDKYNVPVGALMFWKGKGADGHEAVYLGDGNVVSTDVHGDGGVYKASAAEVTKWMGGDNTYLGWSSPVFNSKQTWPSIP